MSKPVSPTEVNQATHEFWRSLGLTPRVKLGGMHFIRVGAGMLDRELDGWPLDEADRNKSRARRY